MRSLIFESNQSMFQDIPDTSDVENHSPVLTPFLGVFGKSFF